jgi:hypothetical protein
MGYSKVPPEKVPVICAWLHLRNTELNAKTAKGACWLCALDVPLERAHIVPREHTFQADSDRPENIADLCRNHHRLFDYVGLDRQQATDFYGVLKYILETCYGVYNDECSECVYRAALVDIAAPYCLSPSLPSELSKTNPERLKGTAASAS